MGNKEIVSIILQYQQSNRKSISKYLFFLYYLNNIFF